jgi:hypothetical protein
MSATQDFTCERAEIGATRRGAGRYTARFSLFEGRLWRRITPPLPSSYSEVQTLGANTNGISVEKIVEDRIALNETFLELAPNGDRSKVGCTSKIIVLGSLRVEDREGNPITAA